MSRLMSVAFTEQAVVERRKTVTRRKGWWYDKTGRQILKPGDRLTLCRKVMGRKPGEPLVRLAEVEVVSIRRERLEAVTARVQRGNTTVDGYGAREMTREGFPGMDPHEFIGRYFTPQGISIKDAVTRIEWRYLDLCTCDAGDALWSPYQHATACPRFSLPNQPTTQKENT